MQDAVLIPASWPPGVGVELIIGVHEACDDVESRVCNGFMLKRFLCVFSRGGGWKVSGINYGVYFLHTRVPQEFTHERPISSCLSAELAHACTPG